MDVNEKVSYLEVQHARLEERVEDLEEWRKKTNGHLERIESKLNGIGWGIAGILGGVVVQLFLKLAGR